jgi:hypothetical protein
MSTLWMRGHLVLSSARQERLIPFTLRPPVGADATG